MTAPTCGTCGRACLPDGDCYGCEADRQRQLAAALAEASNMWRAHAEALAGALQDAVEWAGHPSAGEGLMWYDPARAALARLPADALAERRALEAVADTIQDRDWTVAIRALRNEDMTGAANALEAVVDALAARDAARREGGA